MSKCDELIQKIKQYLFEKTYGEGTDIEPEPPEGWYEKGKALYYSEKYEEAIEALEKAIEINSDYAEGWNGKGAALHVLGRNEEAIVAYNKAIKIDLKYFHAWYNKGNALSDLGKEEEAITAYDKAIELDETEWQPFNNKASVLGKLGRFKEALVQAEKVLELDDKSYVIHLILGELYLSLEILKDAQKHIDITLETDEGKEDTDVWKTQGKIQLEKKEYEGAIQSFEKAISLDPGNPLPIFWLAYARFLRAEFRLKNVTTKEKPTQNNSYREEIHFITTLLIKAEMISRKHHDRESRAYIRYFLGFLYNIEGNYDQSIKILKDCVEKDSTIRPAARDFLANVWNLNKRPNIIIWWLDSPTDTWCNRFISSALLGFFMGLIIFHPYVINAIPELKWTIYYILMSVPIIILLLPITKFIRTPNVEIELQAPLSFDPVMQASPDFGR